MFTFTALMLLSLVGLLFVASIGTKATTILAGLLLALQGFTIYAYTAYVTERDGAPAYERCETIDAGSDLAPILEQDHGYTLEFVGNNPFGAPQYVAHSPACGSAY